MQVIQDILAEFEGSKEKLGSDTTPRRQPTFNSYG